MILGRPDVLLLNAPYSDDRRIGVRSGGSVFLPLPLLTPPTQVHDLCQTSSVLYRGSLAAHLVTLPSITKHDRAKRKCLTHVKAAVRLMDDDLGSEVVLPPSLQTSDLRLISFRVVPPSQSPQSTEGNWE